MKQMLQWSSPASAVSNTSSAVSGFGVVTFIYIALLAFIALARPANAEETRLTPPKPPKPAVMKIPLEPAVFTPTWRVSVGYSYIRSRISFDTGSYTTDIDIAAKLGGRYGQRADVGDLNSYYDREYDDGYVRKDFGTEIWGDTWYWGYDNSSQVQAGNLVFHAYDGIVAVGAGEDSTVLSAWKDDSGNDSGIILQADLVLTRTRELNYGVLLGLSQSSFSAFRTVEQSCDTYVERYIMDTYDLAGVIPPPAPYRGTKVGPGPVIIGNIPSSRSVSTRTFSGVYSEIRESLEIDLATFSLGGFVEYNPNTWYLAASIGPTASLVKMDTVRGETLYGSQGERVLQAWSDKESESEWKIGVFGQTEVGVHVFKDIRFGIFGRYDWFDDVSGDIGPSRYKVKFSSLSCGAKISWDL